MQLNSNVKVRQKSSGSDCLVRVSGYQNLKEIQSEVKQRADALSARVVPTSSEVLEQVTRLSKEKSAEDVRELFTYPVYNIIVKAYPTNEIHLRFNPHIGKYGDTSQDRELKRLGLRLENGEIKQEKNQVEGIIGEVKKAVKKLKKGWGLLPLPKNFTKKMSTKTMRMLAALEAEFGKENGRFLTATLPGSTELAKAAFAKQSGWWFNIQNKWVWERIGGDAGYTVAVWEWQKRGALHIHTAIFSRDKEGLKKIDREYKKQCYDWFSQISKKTGVDVFEKKEGGTWKDNPGILRCDSQRIEKSIVCYMSKYMSKVDSKTESSLQDGVIKYYPSSWVHSGMKAKAVLKKRTVEIGRKQIGRCESMFLAEEAKKMCYDWALENYQKPKIYRDKVGGGVNIKMIVKPENLDLVIGYLEDYINEFEEVKREKIDTELPGMEVVNNKFLEEVEMHLAMQNIYKNTGSNDVRHSIRWKMNNPNPVPVATSDEAWQKFYGEQCDRSVCGGEVLG